MSHNVKYGQGFRSKTKEILPQKTKAIQGNMNDNDVGDDQMMMMVIY